MSDISSFVSGLSSSINQYVQAGQQQERKQQEQQSESDLDVQKQKTLDQNKIDTAGKVDPDMAESLIPGSSKWVTGFQQQNGRLPTVAETQTGLESVLLKLKAQSDKSGKDQETFEKQQDKLEHDYNQNLVSVRGDQSLMRVERQRDAAGMAYDTIAKAKSETRDLTELEQTDLIGQLWQARTGKAPTDQDMKQLNDQTAKRGFNHMITYLTGNPSLVGASTPETLANLQQFVESTGSKADQQWDGYMGPRMNPPSRLEKSRAEHIANQHRGISFANQKISADKTYKSDKSTEAKRAALRTKLGL